MKRVGRRRVPLAVCVCWCVLVGRVALGQAIPPAVKQAASIDSGSRQAIDLAVSQHVQKLTDQDPDAQRQAREAIVGELRLPGGEPTPAFMGAYSESLGNAVMKLPKETPVRTLLNAAIAVARVAELSKSTKLEPVVLWLLGENQPEAIKLWGMKAARWITPELAKLKMHKKLMPVIVQTVKNHPSGAITAEAYESLLVSDPLAIDELLNLVTLRTSMYQGPEAPEDPNVDYTPFASFLSVKGWPTLNPQQRVRVMQAICHLIVLGARHADAAEAQTIEQEQLVSLVQQTAKALQAIALQLGNQALQNVAAGASRATPPTMSSAAKEVCPAIKQVKGFEGVQEPSVGGAGVGGAEKQQ